MSVQQLLKIIVGEFESGSKEGHLLYGEIMKTLWEKGFPGATVLRASEGIGEEEDFRRFIIEDVQFNNLPIVIETVHQRTAVQAVLPELKKQVKHGVLLTMDANNLFREELKMNSEYSALKIYIKEGSHWLKAPLYEELLAKLAEHHFIWSTLTKGIEGFGEDRQIHKKTLFSLSSKMPLVIQSVGKTEDIQDVLPDLKEMVNEGLIYTTPAQIEVNR